jgi:hypothetical protein
MKIYLYDPETGVYLVKTLRMSSLETGRVHNTPDASVTPPKVGPGEAPVSIVAHSGGKSTRLAAAKKTLHATNNENKHTEESQ